IGDHEADGGAKIGGGAILKELHQPRSAFFCGIAVNEGFFIFIAALDDLVEDADENGHLNNTGGWKDSVRIYSPFPTRPQILYINAGDTMEGVDQRMEQGFELLVGALRADGLPGEGKEGQYDAELSHYSEFHRNIPHNRKFGRRQLRIIRRPWASAGP